MHLSTYICTQPRMFKMCSTRGQHTVADKQLQPHGRYLGLIKTGEEGIRGRRWEEWVSVGGNAFSKGATNEHISVANRSKVTWLAGSKGPIM